MEEIGDDDSFFVDCPLEESTSSNVFLEGSFSSTVGNNPLEDPEFQSTPIKPRPKTSKQQKAGAERLQCPQCPNTYANERTLAVHAKMHAMKSASSRIPKEPEMVLLTKEAVIQGLQEIQREESKSAETVNLSLYCSSVEECVKKGEGEALYLFLARHFLSILRNQNILLPSALRNTIYRQTNHLLNCAKFEMEFMEHIGAIKETSPEILKFCVGNLCFKVFTWQLDLCLGVLRGQSSDVPVIPSRPQISADILHPQEFQQMVYHIGGSVLRGIIKKSKLYSSNSTWVAYGDVVNKKFLMKPLSSDLSNCMSHVMCFTRAKDRGALLYCNQEAFDFFMSLFQTIMSVEGWDHATLTFSLSPKVVENKVLDNDMLIFMWDELVGADLSEEQSFYLLSDILGCCVKVVAKGILLRRLNEELAKSYSSVALRHKLAR